jgi:hypothetical protein
MRSALGKNQTMAGIDIADGSPIRSTSYEADWTVFIEQAAIAYLNGGAQDACDVLTPIAGMIWPGIAKGSRPTRTTLPTLGDSRPNSSKSVAATTFFRDHFHCRYCWGRCIPTPVLALMAEIAPSALPYVWSLNSGQVHPVFWRLGCEADHLAPGNRGGSWIDPDNIVTACLVCNTLKSDLLLEELGWRLLPIPASTWDGLTSLYPALWERAGRPNGSHRQWLRAFGAT